MSIHVTPPARPLPEGVLPAKHLRITEEELAALLWTREKLATGLMQHDPGETFAHRFGFNMNFALAEGDCDGECGTTGCIGGWMFYHLDANRAAPLWKHGLRLTDCTSSMYVARFRSPALHTLFYPLSDRDGYGSIVGGNTTLDIDYPAIPPEWALEAIDNFLTVGDPDWASVTGQA